MCPKRTDDSLSLNFKLIVVGWSWKMLDCLLILFSAAMSNSIVPFSPFHGFFCRSYKSGATTTIITIFTCLIMQPSSHTFLLMA